MLALTCCQDHILTENIWFVCSETSYSGDERRCHRCGTTDEQLKIELLSQWKLEAESRNSSSILGDSSPLLGKFLQKKTGSCRGNHFFYLWVFGINLVHNWSGAIWLFFGERWWHMFHFNLTLWNFDVLVYQTCVHQTFMSFSSRGTVAFKCAVAEKQQKLS